MFVAYIFITRAEEEDSLYESLYDHIMNHNPGFAEIC